MLRYSCRQVHARSLMAISRPMLPRRPTTGVSTTFATQETANTTAATTKKSSTRKHWPIITRVTDASVGLVAGGVVGCGFGSPFGSCLGLFLETASGGSGIGGFLNGALVGGICGGGLGSAVGIGIGVTAGRRALLRPNTLSVVGSSRSRLGGAILDALPLEPYADALLNTLPFRGRLISFLLGLVLGSGGLSFMLIQWRWENQASIPLDKEELRPEDAVTFAGTLDRWVGWGESTSSWWPHWEQNEAQIRSGILYLCSSSNNPNTGDLKGISLAVPLADLKMKRTDKGLFALTTACNERLFLRVPEQQDRELWYSALKGSLYKSRLVVNVSFPETWEAPVDTKPTICKLKPSDKEYKRVAKLAERQQFKPNPGQNPYVKGKLKVTGVSRIQSPHVWHQYCMRRLAIAQENDGDPNEKELWHGTPSVDVIIKQGFDPRVCSLQGMFGGGVYFADKTTKSVRYCGNINEGQLLLCRVALGRPMMKRSPAPDLRRPPDPLPLYPTHMTTWLRGQSFHSVFADADAWLSSLLMNEYIVYETNQAYPDYIVDFIMK